MILFFSGFLTGVVSIAFLGYFIGRRMNQDTGKRLHIKEFEGMKN